MCTPSTQGASVPTFCASAWLADWSDNGGIAFVASGRLYLSRTPATGRAGGQALDTLRDAILRDRDRGEALAGYLTARSFGETQDNPCPLCRVTDWHPEHGERCQLPGCPVRKGAS